MMKHINLVSRTPRSAQTPMVSLSALFQLVGDILFAIGTAVVAKENSSFPTVPTTGG